MVDIREVRPEDASALEDLTRKAWIEGQRQFLTGEEVKIARDSEIFDKTEEGIGKKLESEECKILVAEKEGELAGRIRVSWDGDAHDFTGDNAQLRSLYVHPEHWRNGIATSLEEKGLEFIPERFDSVLVEVFKENETAIKFYKSAEFEAFEKDSLGPKDIDLLVKERETVIMRKEM